MFEPFAIASTPFAYLGGALTLPENIYKPLVRDVLIYAAWRLFITAHNPALTAGVRPHLALLLLAGTALGFLSGLTGIYVFF